MPVRTLANPARSAHRAIRASRTISSVADRPAFTVPVRRSSDPADTASSTTTTTTTAFLSRKLSSPLAATGPTSVNPRARDFDPAAPEPTNPIDRVSWSRYDQARTAYETRRTGLYALGAIAGMAGMLGVIMFIGDPENADKSRQQPSSSIIGQSALKCDGPVGFDAPTSAGVDKITRDGYEIVAADSTNVPYFPKTITVPSSPDDGTAGDEFVLVGLGVRTVSFISIKVYVVGMYVKTSQLSQLRTKLEQAASRSGQPLDSVLVDPTLSYDVWNDVLRFDPTQSQSPTSSPAPVDTVFRIVPTRSTDFNHMRDGFVNGVRAVTTDFRQRRREHAHEIKSKSPDLTTATASPVSSIVVDADNLETDTFAASMRSFQSIFGGRGKVPFGSGLILRRSGQDGSLDIWTESRDTPDGTKVPKAETLVMGYPNTQKYFLGRVSDERVSRLLWLRYLAGRNVSSEPARKSIADGIVRSES